MFLCNLITQIIREKKSGVYEVKCKGGEKYILMAKHCVSVRISESERDSNLDNPVSGLPNYFRSEHHQRSSFRTIHNFRNNVDWTAMEACSVILKKLGLNTDNRNLYNAWTSLIEEMLKKRKP